MTGKLLKYELRSSYEYMLGIWGAIIATSLIAAVTPAVTGDESSLLVQFLKQLPNILYGVSVAALGVAMVFIIVFRFYKGLLGEEGYLMHTLPVKEWQLITAKGLSAFIFTVGSCAAMLISVMVYGRGVFFDADFIKELSGVIGALSFDDYLIGIELIFLIVFSILKTIYQVYAALAIGQLSDKHRILVSVGAYIGISIALTVIFAGLLGSLAPAVDLMGFDPFTSEHEYMYIQSLLGIGDSITGLDVRCTRLEDSLEVRNALREKLADVPNLKIDDWRTLNSSLFSAIMLEKVAMFTILTSIILVASFNILCLLIMMVIEKAREIAIFKAMGTTDQSVVRIFVIQGAVIGGLGTLIGLVLGLGLCWLIMSMGIKMPGEVHYITQLPVTIEPLEVVMICCASIIISLLATVLPARMAVKLDPVDGLRCE